MLGITGLLMATSLATCFWGQDFDAKSKDDEQHQLMDRIFAAGGDAERSDGEIVSVNLRDATNETFELLKELKAVKYLDCSSCKFDGEGLKHIAQMKSLQKLWLADNVFVQRHLTHISALPRLRTLWLEDTNLTDCGICHLWKLESLEELYLANTKITDKSVPILSNLTKLKSLDLDGTDLTPAGVERLRRALPNCEVFGP